MRGWKCLAVSLWLVCGCSRKAAERKAEAPAIAGPASAVTSTVGERLGREAAARPAAVPSVEQVERALTDGGYPVTHVRQVLAGAGARYCAALQTKGILALSLCEFDAPAAAQAGLERSRDTLGKAMPGRLLAVNGSTLLTIGPGAPAEDSRAVAELFATLAR